MRPASPPAIRTAIPRGSRRSAFVALAAVSAMIVHLGSGAFGQTSPEISEKDLKSALVFGLAKLVIWPDNAFASNDSPLRLGVLGKHTFGNGLDALAAKKLPNVRPVIIVYASEAAILSDCHLVFVSKDRRESLSTVVKLFRSKPVLLVGEEEGFADSASGGMVNILIRDERPTLQVNQGAAEGAGLRFRAQMTQSKRVEWVGRPKN